MNKRQIMLMASRMGGYVKRGGAFVAPLLASIVFGKGEKYIMDKMAMAGIKNYEDAVNAILSSNMFSTDKRQAIELISINEEAMYYKTIARIALSSVYSSEKVNMINDFNIKFERE